MHVLIVDDDELFREELGEIVRREGHAVTLGASVPKAVEALEGSDFDLVLTDLKMPRHSGLELLETVRRRWPGTLVVMITGYATVETAVQAMKVGAFDYLRKPFHLEQVREVLRLSQGQLQFRPSRAGEGDARALVRSWVERDRREVLVVTGRSWPEQPGVTLLCPAELDPATIGASVSAFVRAHARPAVVLEDAQTLFQGRRREAALRFLEQLRSSLQDRSPLAISLDASALAGAEVNAVRAVLSASSTHETLEVLANPLRRAVLRRAAKGPCSFTQAMEAAGVEDSPKLAFHMKRLVDEGFLGHPEEDYRLTAKGREALKLLESADAMPGTETNLVLFAPAPPGSAQDV